VRTLLKRRDNAKIIAMTSRDRKRSKHRGGFLGKAISRNSSQADWPDSIAMDSGDAQPISLYRGVYSL